MTLSYGTMRRVHRDIKRASHSGREVPRGSPVTPLAAQADVDYLMAIRRQRGRQ